MAARAALAIVLIVAVGCNPAAPTSGPRFVRQVDWIGRGTWLKADTHVHTQFSDGAHNVSEVATKAREFGCDVLAITDHGDRELGAGTHEYIEAIAAARREFPELAIVAGIEWNVPPWGGDEHAVVLLPPSAREGKLLAEFKARFDDLGRDEHDPALADEGLEWLAGLTTDGIAPVSIYEHPGRKRKRSGQIVGDLRRWRAVNDVMVGFAGAPGHQAMQPLGAYRGMLQPVDRWDPTVGVGDAWDRLLQQGVDVWAAYAPSDFHDDRGDGLGDYWPGEFSETWLYAPENSAAGALKALRAGTFFGVHGRIAREVELRVATAGLPRAAVAGEAFEAQVGTELTVELSLLDADVDWSGRPSHVDEIELIGVTQAGAEVLATCKPETGGRTLLKTIAAPAGGIVLRARGRRVIDDGPDLMFYTNPVRVVTAVGGVSPGNLATLGFDQANWPLLQFALRPVALVNLGAAALAAAAMLLIATARRSRRLQAQSPLPERLQEADGLSKLRPFAAAAMPHRAHFLLAWLGFVAFAIYGSWVPLDYRPLPWTEAVSRFREIPFLHLSIASRADWVANILLFVPIGFCGAAAWLCDRRGWLIKACAAIAVFFFCATLSVAIEFSQVWFPPRTVSQNDIVAETMGGAAGIASWLLFGDAFARWLSSFVTRRGARQQFDWLLQAYLLGLVLYSLFPLDLTISPAELWHKYGEGKFHFVPFAGFHFTVQDCFALASDVLLFVPVGMLTPTAWRDKGLPARSLFHSLLAGLVMAAGIECAQTFVYSRYVDVTDLLTAAIGILAGAAWRRRRLGRASERSLSPAQKRGWATLHLLTYFAYALFLAAFFVLPFPFIQDAGRIQRRWLNFFGVPLTSLYWSTEYNALTQVLRKGLLFAPLGYLSVRMAVLVSVGGRARMAALAAGLGGAFALAFGIEYAQIWRDETTATFTDVLLCTFGAAAALALTLRMNDSPEPREVLASTPRAEAVSSVRPIAKLPLAASGWLLLAAGCALVGLGFSAAWAGAAWRGSPGSGVGIRAPSTNMAPLSPESDSNVVFTRPPSAPQNPPEISPIELPGFRGAYAIWGATGRDDRGHIFFGVSAAGLQQPSAHLFELEPDRGAITDRGDALGQLARAGLLRPGEGQMKIHSKIVQAADGCLYFASMDEQGESDSAGRLPDWGSHLWRLRPGEEGWEHLLAAPEGLIAVAASGAHVYALGYYDHVLYQFDCTSGHSRSIHVGSTGGHISRNFFCDYRGHVYVPRLRAANDSDSPPRASLVEFDATLTEISETPINHYLPGGDLSSHGIVGVQPLADGSIAFTTHVGFLYRVSPPSGNPLDHAPAEVRPLGWFHPRGQAYVSSLFTFDGSRHLLGAAEGKPFEWLVFDLERRTSIATPLPETATAAGLLLYGSTTRDDEGAFYLVGAETVPPSLARDKGAAPTRPIALRLTPQ